MLFAFTVAIIILACDDDSKTNRNSVEYFKQHLHVDMKYDELKTRFGSPDNDLGSGIHIYVYNLDDGTKVVIGFTDKILYARHVASDDQLLEEII